MVPVATGDIIYTSSSTSGGAYQFNPNPNYWPNTTTPPITGIGITSIGGGGLINSSPCQFSGHEIEEITEFRDHLGEEMYGVCSQCGERIKVKSQPGGVSYAEVKDFFADLLVGMEVTGEVLAMYTRLKEAVLAEREALDHAEDLLKQAAWKLQEKGV